jgi:hypothetical protein
LAAKNNLISKFFSQKAHTVRPPTE